LLTASRSRAASCSRPPSSTDSSPPSDTIPSTSSRSGSVPKCSTTSAPRRACAACPRKGRRRWGMTASLGDAGLDLNRRRLLDAEQRRELARLVHLAHDVAAADQLALDEQLRDRRPVRDRRELLADARIREDVDGREVRAERVEGGHGARREAAAGLLGGALH